MYIIITSMFNRRIPFSCVQQPKAKDGPCITQHTRQFVCSCVHNPKGKYDALQQTYTQKRSFGHSQSKTPMGQSGALQE